MADTPTFNPNPYANFDPSQWLNPYSQFYGKALPWPSSYAGAPTNALGQPIQPPPGMTLNQTPAQPQAQPQQPDMMAMRNAALTGQPGAALAYGANFAPQGSPPGIQAMYGRNFAAFTPQQNWQGNATPAAAAPSAPNNWQQTLSMLANPGPVTTPGATVPQAAAGGGQPTPGVLQNFLANWKPASSGPGAGFTQNFNTILRGLQGG